jgi:hypothetical protein
VKAYAIATGKKDGWIAHTYRKKFGVFPNDPRLKGVAPIEYSDDVRKWITHQNIAFAKSQHKRVAA